MPTVNPDILQWARKTAGLTPEDAVRKLSLRDGRGVSAIDRLKSLESGYTEPTRPMLLKMAKQYHRPLLTFYMSAPPGKGNRGQDFRTLPEEYSVVDEALLDSLIRNIQARQSMVRAIIEDEDEVEALSFVGSAQRSDSVDTIAKSIQRTINFDLDEFRSQRTPNDAFKLLRERVEDAGIFVLLIGNLGSHHTALDIEVFRGFAIADDIAPFIIINDQDAHSAWSFTLLHELAHLWLGQTGVSGAKTEIATERFCNDIAGEILLPTQQLMTLSINNTTDIETAKELISSFAKERNISNSMVAYKLFSNGIIGHDTWNSLSRLFRRIWLHNRKEKRDQARNHDSQDPDYFVVRRHRVGATLINFIGRMMAAGAVTTIQAGKILGVKACNVHKLTDAY